MVSLVLWLSEAVPCVGTLLCLPQSWGLCLARSRWKRLNGCFIFGIAQGFALPPHQERSRADAGSNFSREEATEPNEVASKNHDEYGVTQQMSSFQPALTRGFVQHRQMVGREGRGWKGDTPGRV